MYEKILEVKGVAKGTIRRVIPDIGLGAVWDKKNKQDIFFSTVTEFINTSYGSLKAGDTVEVLVVRTARGLFAKNLTLKEACPPQKEDVPLEL